MPMHIDFASPAWQQVAAWAGTRIDELRRKNDGDLDAAQTASLRGQIKAFRELVGLPETAARNLSAESVQRPTW